jgi:hypothetical protein
MVPPTLFDYGLLSFVIWVFGGLQNWGVWKRDLCASSTNYDYDYDVNTMRI